MNLGEKICRAQNGRIVEMKPERQCFYLWQCFDLTSFYRVQASVKINWKKVGRIYLMKCNAYRQVTQTVYFIVCGTNSSICI